MGEASNKLTGHQNLKSLVYPLRVIVSPFKAFRDITQNPNVMGLLLIVGLFLVAAAGSEYIRASKIILDAQTQSTSLLNSSFFGSSLLIVLVQSFFSFLLIWITYAGVLFFVSRFFGDKSGSLRPFLVIVGHVFSALVVYYAITAVLIATLPEIHFEMSIWTSGKSEDINKVFNEMWGSTFASQASSYLGIAYQFWLVVLGSIVVHTSREVKWGSALMISVAAYFASVLITTFLSLLTFA